MPMDVYSKRNEINQRLTDQKKRLDTAKSTFEQFNQNPDRNNFVKTPFTGSNFRDSAYEKAKGAYDAESHAANVEIQKLQEQLEEEEKRIGQVKPFAELQEKQEMRAKQFRQAFPSILDSRMGQERTSQRQKIAEGLAGNREQFNNRGLLYSGMRAGADADVGRDMEAQLAQKAVETNQQLEDQATQLDQAAIDTGLTAANVSQNLANTSNEYRQQLIDQLINSDAQRLNTIGAALGAGGLLGGTALGEFSGSRLRNPQTRQTV